jgi:hypothetical protein
MAPSIAAASEAPAERRLNRQVHAAALSSLAVKTHAQQYRLWMAVRGPEGNGFV